MVGRAGSFWKGGSIVTEQNRRSFRKPIGEAVLIFIIAGLGLLLGYQNSVTPPSNNAEAAPSGANVERADRQAEWRMNHNLDRANPSDVIVVSDNTGERQWYVVIGYSQQAIVVTQTGDRLLLKKVETFINGPIRPENNRPGETGYVILRQIVRDAYKRIKNAPSLSRVVSGDQNEEIDRGQLISDLARQLKRQRIKP